MLRPTLFRPALFRLVSLSLFALLHAAALAAFLIPASLPSFAWLIATYTLRMFGVTAGYHRYFSHRSYKLGRAAQFLLALLAETSGQKGILWWAAQHRVHHRLSDTEHDVHSPWTQSFWWAHLGWILSRKHEVYDSRLVADFARFPELRWLDRHYWLPPAAFGAAVLLLGGWPAFLWGFVLSTVLLYHCTFAINSFAHVYGTRRFATPDQSRNNWLLALLTLGEGWHNNHHASMSSCSQGYRWWEIDLTYWVLRLLSLLRIARDLKPFRAREPA